MEQSGIFQMFPLGKSIQALATGIKEDDSNISQHDTTGINACSTLDMVWGHGLITTGVVLLFIKYCCSMKNRL